MAHSALLPLQVCSYMQWMQFRDRNVYFAHGLNGFDPDVCAIVLRENAGAYEPWVPNFLIVGRNVYEQFLAVAGIYELSAVDLVTVRFRSAGTSLEERP